MCPGATGRLRRLCHRRWCARRVFLPSRHTPGQACQFCLSRTALGFAHALREARPIGRIPSINHISAASASTSSPCSSATARSVPSTRSRISGLAVRASPVALHHPVALASSPSSLLESAIQILRHISLNHTQSLSPACPHGEMKYNHPLMPW